MLLKINAEKQPKQHRAIKKSVNPYPVQESEESKLAARKAANLEKFLKMDTGKDVHKHS